MKKTIAIFLVSYILAGCASVANKEAFNNELVQSANAMASAKNKAAIDCDGDEQCKKAFALTKVFIQNNATMRIAHSDDSTITTFRPRKLHDIGMQASLVPDQGSRATVVLDISCLAAIPSQNVSFAMGAHRTAVRTVVETYEGYGRFVRSRL